MKVRWRILALEIASLLFILVIIAVMAVALQSAGQLVERIDGLHRRFEALSTLDSRANNYAGQVAEVLLLGRDGMEALQTARVEMERGLSQLMAVTRAEIAGLTDMAEVETELRDLENARRMVELYHAIDSSAARAIALDRDGDRETALQMFQREVAFRLTNELQTLLDTAVREERNEVAGEFAEIRGLQQTLLVWAGIIVVVAIASVVVLGLLLHRAIVPPLRALTGGAEAIAAGELDHRIAVSGNDEFAALSRGFNDMAAAIGEQRGGLLKAGERLGAEVEARTSQLRTANERLREVDQRRAQFLADVSHELRTPLTILRGEADVALRGQAGAGELRSALERIQGEAIELGQLLEDLIAFARSDAEGQQHVPAEIRLDEVVAAAAQEGEVLAEPKEVAVALALDDGGARVDADFRRLKQALLIGLDNAVRHAPPGSRIAIETAVAGGEARIRILDEGPGIAEEDRPRLFERFYRGRSAGEAPDQGLGIGLAIARDIVERHGGRIALGNRADGNGAVLEISLPLAGGGPE